MAEGSAPYSPTSQSSNIGKTLQKTVLRTKEKMMQSFGMNDKTTDAEFDLLAATFTEQQAVATRLLTEYKNYVKQVKVLQTASESLQQAIREAYESQWPDSQSYNDVSERLTDNWTSYTTQLEEAQSRIAAYVERFNELKQKIAKRGRKATDYDCARHTAQSLDSARKRDSFKITKAQNDTVVAKQVYESMNYELQGQLREHYESRLSSICLYLSTMYEAEASFLGEAAKMKQQLAAAARSAVASGPAVTSSTLYSKQTSANSSGDVSCPDSPTQHGQRSDQRNGGNAYEDFGDVVQKSTERNINLSAESKTETVDFRVSSITSPVTSPISPASRDPFNASSNSSSLDDGTALANGADSVVYSVPVKNIGLPETNNVVTVAPPLLVFDETTANEIRNGDAAVDKRVKYQVAAIFDYEAGDEDELSFRIGDVINVIDFENPEDVDEGWLMGVKVPTGEKGILPENFTRKI